MLNNVNEELRDIAVDLSIDNRIETMANREAFVTARDHKENFEDNPKFRLINPAKSELGKVSKIILDEINNNIRERTGVNQWRNSQSVIDWFKTINDKPIPHLYFFRHRGILSVYHGRIAE
jgi:glutaredoxin-related protein